MLTVFPDRKKIPLHSQVVQSVVHVTQEPEVQGSTPVPPHTFISPSADSRGAVVSCWRKYVHRVLVNHLGGPSLSRKSVVRLTDRPNITTDVYCGQQYNQPTFSRFKINTSADY